MKSNFNALASKTTTLSVIRSFASPVFAGSTAVNVEIN